MGRPTMMSMIVTMNASENEFHMAPQMMDIMAESDRTSWMPLQLDGMLNMT